MKLALITDPVASAKAAGLRYVNDNSPGIKRKKVGKNFSYIGLDGKPIRDPAELQRIKSLGIPPAYTDVWICPNPQGHIQATGRDARGRKQYRYHPRWREVRDETKYGRTLAFGEALPAIRARVEQDLNLPRLPRNKVLAAVVRLLETTLIRVGNAEYERANNSFGLTTMHDEHVKISGQQIRFKFRGKSGKDHNISISDPRLARIVKRCRDIPGYKLFQYLDDNGNPQTIDSSDVNEYLHEITGQDFTAKDFRTWSGTVLAALALKEFEAFDTDTQAKKNVVRAIEQVAERLGNTPTICRKCYVHPEVIASYLDKTLLENLAHQVEQATQDDPHALNANEKAVMALLHQRLATAQAVA